MCYTGRCPKENYWGDCTTDGGNCPAVDVDQEDDLDNQETPLGFILPVVID